MESFILWVSLSMCGDPTIKDLESPKFAIRDAAHQELKSLGLLSRPAMKHLVKSNLSETAEFAKKVLNQQEEFFKAVDEYQAAVSLLLRIGPNWPDNDLNTWLMEQSYSQHFKVKSLAVWLSLLQEDTLDDFETKWNQPYYTYNLIGMARFRLVSHEYPQHPEYPGP